MSNGSGEVIESPIKIDSQAIRLIVAQGIVNSLSGEQQQLIITEAINFLLDEHDQYGVLKKGESPLARAFRREVLIVAEEVMKEYLATPEMSARIRKAVQEGAKKA